MERCSATYHSRSAFLLLHVEVTPHVEVSPRQSRVLTIISSTVYIFKVRTVVGVFIVTLIAGMAVLTQIFYIPQYIQVVRGLGAIESGVIIIPLLIVVTFMVFVCQSLLLSCSSDFSFPHISLCSLPNHPLTHSSCSRSTRGSYRPLPLQHHRRLRNLDSRTRTAFDHHARHFYGEADRISRYHWTGTRSDVADYSHRGAGCL